MMIGLLVALYWYIPFIVSLYDNAGDDYLLFLVRIVKDHWLMGINTV
jgi:hypothetical protein